MSQPAQQQDVPGAQSAWTRRPTAVSRATGDPGS